MDTNKLKRFASEARNILISGVNQRLSALGFSMDGSVTEMPELKGGGAIFMGDIQTEDFYHKWMSLYHRVQSHSYREVVEETAYTWFNRLVAIRIMVKNELVPPVLEYESEGVRIPLLVTEARQGRMPQMNEESRQKLDTLLLNDAFTDEQFQVLIVAYCHSNPIINKCFGTISDYTELLLPSNILKNDGFIARLNADDYITDEDYHSPELIGWLYQFYISERKDEVFAKKEKFEADEIPAATQIFTPNWIVKYMVQNTVGRIYLDNNPYSDIKDGMKYLVEPAEPTLADSIYQFEDIHHFTCADLGCGSGHILNECFDLLYQIYIEEGYNRRKAIEDIFRYNLTGVDIDTRAKQLATFALLMKACQKDVGFTDAHCMPKVLNMPVGYAEAMNRKFDNREDERSFIRGTVKSYIMANNTEMLDELTDAIVLMNDAQTLGSIMKFDISERTRNVIAVRTAEYKNTEHLPENIQKLLPYMKVILALTQRYSVLVMNPPYMGGGNMNELLSKYVKKNYEYGKADLATVFVLHMANLTMKHGKYAFIIPPSWMFLSTFENLRCDIIDNRSIDSLLHLSRGVFGADFGASSAVISNTQSSDAKGTYFRLIERTFQEFDQKHLQMLFEQTLANHDFKYYFEEYSKDVTELPNSKKGNKIYYPNIPQKNFEKIPGSPIGYWVSEKEQLLFKKKIISDISKPCKGIDTGENSYFLRFWHEINFRKIDSSNGVGDYVPYNKGGGFRKWYGFRYCVLKWNGSDEELSSRLTWTTKKPTLRNKKYWFNESFTWSSISSGGFSARYSPRGALFDNGGSSIFSESILFLIGGLINSIVAKRFFDFLAPTINYQPGDVGNLAFSDVIFDKQDVITPMVNNNISISKQDWDAHETSWDFQENELLRIHMNTGGNLKQCFNEYKEEWAEKFLQLHENEEELNRQFIYIYGLQDELTPDVPLSEITILQQGEIEIVELNAENEEGYE